jgi:hypothetical protein
MAIAVTLQSLLAKLDSMPCNYASYEVAVLGHHATIRRINYAVSFTLSPPQKEICLSGSYGIGNAN